ncbi:MAG: sigma-54-dependent Fis family transcriptional regulator, partial [bacterium]|nr:sigma-54-dependent Fis family transcriptional regulator [bacterium]
RLYVLSDNGVVKVDDIPDRIKFQENTIPQDLISDEFNPFATAIDLNELIMEYEKKLILHALNMNKWVKSRAAKYLKINRTTLIEKMKRLGIKDVSE